jgi:hypothetical protein
LRETRTLAGMPQRSMTFDIWTSARPPRSSCLPGPSLVPGAGLLQLLSHSQVLNTPGFATFGPGMGFAGLQGSPALVVRPGGNHRFRGLTVSERRRSPLARVSPLLSERPFQRGLLPSCSSSAFPVHARSPQTRGEAQDDGAARWPSQLPSLAFDDDGCHLRCLRGPNILGASIRIGDECSTLLTFAPSFPTRPGPAARTPVDVREAFPTWSPMPFAFPPGRPSFLSWDCPKIAPPSSCSSGSPLPEEEPLVAQVLRPPSG